MKYKAPRALGAIESVILKGKRRRCKESSTGISGEELSESLNYRPLRFAERERLLRARCSLNILSRYAAAAASSPSPSSSSSSSLADSAGEKIHFYHLLAKESIRVFFSRLTRLRARKGEREKKRTAGERAKEGERSPSSPGFDNSI